MFCGDCMIDEQTMDFFFSFLKKCGENFLLNKMSILLCKKKFRCIFLVLIEKTKWKVFGQKLFFFKKTLH